MEGHIVQAPNSYLNTLFILNMRRSGGLAEAVPLTVKFGTTLEQIDDLRARLLEYVKAEKREYQPNILTEIRDVVEAYSVNLNVIFFYKSNWQNELLRLQRRNKFICALMITMQEIGIEGPRRRIPGSKEDNPFYYQAIANRVTGANSNTDGLDNNGEGAISGRGARSGSLAPDPPFVPQTSDPLNRNRSILRSGTSASRTRPRGESISAMSKRVDFSLGMKDISSADIMGDLDDRRTPEIRIGSSSRSRSARARIDEDADEEGGRAPDSNYDQGRLVRADSRVSGSRFGIGRMGTNDSKMRRSSGSFIHRNRFFSRSKKRENGSEEEDLMEQGMMDNAEGGPHVRTDPRSGMVSGQAVRPSMESESSNAGPETASRAPPPGNSAGRQDFQERLQLQRLGGSTQREDFEMRNMKS